MAKRTFALNTEPHVATIGSVEFEFLPEVIGDEFLDAYNALQETYKAAGINLDDLANVDTDRLRQVTASLRTFLTAFMLPESAERFASERFPDRILIQLMEWVTEIYSGGENGKRPPTSSTGSSTPSRKGGKAGMAASPSKASTPTPGLSDGS